MSEKPSPGLNWRMDRDVLRALGLVRTGRVIELNHIVGPATPRIEGVNSPYSICLWQFAASSRRAYVERGARNGIGFTDERVELDFHTGTHIDALGHASIDGQFYGGLSEEEVVTSRGLSKLGAEEIPPLITRAVGLDFPRFLGRALRPGEAITLPMLDEALAAAGADPGPGDIVLVRTGWDELYGSDPKAFVGPAPGITLGVAERLVECQVAAIGADTMSLEVIPPEDKTEPYIVHQYMLAKSGVFIIEQADLRALATLDSAIFCCMALGPRFKGASGALLRLVAVI